MFTLTYDPDNKQWTIVVNMGAGIDIFAHGHSLQQALDSVSPLAATVLADELMKLYASLSDFSMAHEG